jgi:hypothetical protein
MTTENKVNNVAEVRVRNFGFGANKVKKYAVVKTQPIFSLDDINHKNPIHVTYEGKMGALAFPLTAEGLKSARDLAGDINKDAVNQSNNRKRKAN